MKKTRTDFLCEILIIFLFLFMSVTACSRHTINFDEFYTMQWCRCDRSEFFYEVLHDTSPFLYYFMIRPFAILTGQNIFMARLFSLTALLILLLIGVTFVKKEHGRKAMLFYLAILYLNPFMLQKSTEIRMYLWAGAFTLLSGVFCYKLLLSPTRRNWISFTLLSLLAACTHYYAVLTLVFLYLGLLFFYLFSHNRKAVRNWLICALITVIAYLPLLLIAVAQIRESSGNWITEPDSRLAPLKELFYSEIPGTEYLYPAVMAGFTFYAFILLIRNKKAEYYWAFVCCCSLWGIVAFGIIFGELVKPIMLSRYLIIPVCLLFLGITPTVKHTGRYLILLLCLCFAITGALRYRTGLETLRNDRTVDTLRFSESHILDGDKMVLVSGDDYLYNCCTYYIPQAEIYYVGSFDPEQLLEEENLREFWFFDNGGYLEPEALKRAGLSANAFGRYQLGYLSIDIYRISP